MDVLYILASAWKKTTKCAFDIDFCAMCSTDLTCVKVSTIQFVLDELLFRINL